MKHSLYSFTVCEPTVFQQFRGIQDLGALLWVGDVQLIEVRLLQSCKVLQALETVHGQQRTQLLKHINTNFYLNICHYDNRNHNKSCCSVTNIILH